MRLAACALAISASTFISPAGRGEQAFDFATTPGKLPKEVVPTDYAVRITPNLEKLTFSGTSTIKVEARKPVGELVLNAADLEIVSASVDDKPLPKTAVRNDNKLELLRVALADKLAEGPHTIAFSFNGKINQQGRGLFYARYQEEGTGTKKTLIGTQFEPSDARRFFPCWDEPSFRARFQFTAVVPQNWMAVSNMPVEAETTVPEGKEVRFGTTPSMSSYLNVFAAGELDVIETQASGVQIRVITTKGKAEWGRYALESSAKILEYYNEYFGVPYPLPKLDQIALPGGFGGAMENWGGITYYESALLFDPETSSNNTKQDIFAVLAHEMAHQWFGDLVTMAWWDNLWLNEGFASWMGTKCTAHFNPQWEVWLRKSEPRDPTRRIGIPKEQAMEGDARSTTHPIQQPVTTEAEANSAFDDITYKKGQSFIRMLEVFLGQDVFRDGIRRYIAAHKFSNSTTADLWSALSEASGRPVNEIAAGWTEQPGFPVVKVRRDDGGKIALQQERFTINYRNPVSLEWKIPLSYFVLGEPAQTRLVTTKRDQIENVPADRPFKLNVAGAGNYRVQYDPQSWDALVGAIKELDVQDRVNLLSDTWALVEADRVPLPMYFGLLDKLPPTNDLAQWDQLIAVFGAIDGLLVNEPQRDGFQRYARSVLQPVFDRLGWEPTPEEPPDSGSLRASLIESLGRLGDPAIVSGCRERFAQFGRDPKSVPPDLRRAVLAVVGRGADEATWNQLHELGLRTTNIGEKQDYFDALANAREPKLVQKTLAIALSDELPSSRAAFLPGRVARYSEHPELAWEFTKRNTKALLGKIDSVGMNQLVPALFTFFSDPARAAELRAYAKGNLPGASAKEVAKAVDELGFRVEFKARLRTQLTGWIESRPAAPAIHGTD